MSNLLALRVTTSIGSAVQGLGRLTSSVLGIGQAAQATERSTAKTGATIGRLGQAATVAGGALGRMGGTLSGAGGLIAGMGKVGVAIALASAAWRAFTAVSDRAVASVRAQIGLQRELAAATDQARAAAQAAGAGARGQEDTLRQLVAAGGSQADVESLTQRFGVGAADAGTAALALRRSGLDTGNQERVLEAARLLQRTGRASFGEAVQSLSSSQGALAQPTAAGAAAFIASERSGQLVSEGRITSEARLVGRDENLRRFDELRAVEGQTDLRRFDQLQATGVVAAREELARVTDPLAAAMNDLARRRDAEIEVLRRLAEVQGGLSAALSNVGMLFGGEGSFEQQRRRAQINNARAQGF